MMRLLSAAVAALLFNKSRSIEGLLSVTCWISSSKTVTLSTSWLYKNKLNAFVVAATDSLSLGFGCIFFNNSCVVKTTNGLSKTEPFSAFLTKKNRIFMNITDKE